MLVVQGQKQMENQLRVEQSRVNGERNVWPECQVKKGRQKLGRGASKVYTVMFCVQITCLSGMLGYKSFTIVAKQGWPDMVGLLE